MSQLTYVKDTFPEIKSLVIDKIKKGDHKLNEFLKYCCPQKLKYFNFNHNYLGGNDGSDAFEIKEYLDQMKEVMKSTTNEIYLENLIVGEEELSEKVKASCNSERLTIRYSKVSTSNHINFSAPTPYKLKYISFMN